MMQPLLFENLFASQHSTVLLVTYVLRNNSFATFEFFVFFCIMCKYSLYVFATNSYQQSRIDDRQVLMTFMCDRTAAHNSIGKKVVSQMGPLWVGVSAMPIRSYLGASQKVTVRVSF